MTDSLEPDVVVPLLRGRLGRPYLYAAECPSTQDILRASPQPEGAVAVAEHQTAGRGRSGRRWDATPGRAILFSILLQPPPEAPPAPQLSLVAALAVAEAVEDPAGGAAKVKWPNDVWIAGQKVAGILLEASDSGVVCGIGVNVNQAEEELPAGRVEPTSLRVLTGRLHDRPALLADVLTRLELGYDSWLTDGLPGLLPELELRDALHGVRVRVGATSGAADGIAEDGRLAILTSAGERVLVESGEVELEVGP
jgi:BirA family biotin operon repressor/biotin-[acetyl-CoA-carboxylase] ligase